MNKNYSITKNGRPLDKSLYAIDEKHKTFSTNENGLVLDFGGQYGWTFNTRSNCSFNTGSYCSFKTGSYCSFNTRSNCSFNTWSHCSFNTRSNCSFNTYSNCSFKTGLNCSFNTDNNCSFKTGYNCSFIKTGKECVIIRRDVYEVIEIPENKQIKLNGYQIKGYTFVDEKKEKDQDQMINIDGKEISKSTIKVALKNLYYN